MNDSYRAKVIHVRECEIKFAVLDIGEEFLVLEEDWRNVIHDMITMRSITFARFVHLSKCREWSPYYRIKEWDVVEGEICLIFYHLITVHSERTVYVYNWKDNKPQNKSCTCLWSSGQSPTSDFCCQRIASCRWSRHGRHSLASPQFDCSREPKTVFPRPY